MQRLKYIFCFAVITFLPLCSQALCSVCSKVVESGSANGSGLSKGINSAILYLMAFPYVIFMGFMAYRYRELIGYTLRSMVQRWRMS